MRTTMKTLRTVFDGAKFEANVSVIHGSTVMLVLDADYRGAKVTMPTEAPRRLVALGHLLAAEVLVRYDVSRSICHPRVEERETWARGTSTVIKMELADERDEQALLELFKAIAAEVR